MTNLIEVENLYKGFKTFKRREGVLGAIKDLFVREYQTVKAVDHITFHIEPGEMVGYIGPNGAGKSTTIKMLTGILVPSSGHLRVQGIVPFLNRKKHTKRIGVVFGQRTQLWWDIAVIESFKLLKEIYEVPQAEYEFRLGVFNEILDLKQYFHIPVRKLSLGERMRCDLAASLLHNPPLLFLDEPTIGLDVVAKGRVREFLKEINRVYKTTVLLTTHDLSDIEELSQRVMIIDHGKLLFDGPLAELKMRLARFNQIKFFLKDRDQTARIKELRGEGVTCERLDDFTYLLRYDRRKHSSGDIIRNIVTRLEVRDLVVEEESIEEIVKRIYTEGQAYLNPATTEGSELPR